MKPLNESPESGIDVSFRAPLQIQFLRGMASWGMFRDYDSMHNNLNIFPGPCLLIRRYVSLKPQIPR